MPSSSRSSRISVSSGRSPDSILPPGNSHRPSIGLPDGREGGKTGPSEASNAQAGANTSFTDETRGTARSAPIIAVDGDVFLGEIASQHAVGAAAEAEIDREVDHIALHVGGDLGLVIGGIARALGRDANIAEPDCEAVAVPR